MSEGAYQAMRAAVQQGFADGLSVVDGCQPRGDAATEARCRALVDQVVRRHADQILSGACWLDLADPGVPLLRWRFVKNDAPKDQGTRVLLVEGQAWVIDGVGKLIEKLALADGVKDKLAKHGLTLPVLEPKAPK